MKRLAVLFAVLLLVAVAAIGALEWRAQAPAVTGPGGFDLLAFFDGTATSRGTVTVLAEEPFTATFEGAVEDDALRLEERFTFDDGMPLQVWTLRIAGGTITGTVETEDADGRLAAPVAVAGTTDETGVTLSYLGSAPGGGPRRLRFRHRMRMRDDGTVANHVVVRLLGLPVAVSDVTFLPGPAALPSPRTGR